jgi:hypothetical protein
MQLHYVASLAIIISEKITMAPSFEESASPRNSTATGSSKTLLTPLHPTVLPKLDPLFVDYYNKVIGTKVATHTIPLSEARANPGKYGFGWGKNYTGTELVKNWDIPSKDGTLFKVRTYHPDPKIHGRGPYGAHLNYHGKENLSRR